MTEPTSIPPSPKVLALVGPCSRSISEGRRTSPQLPISAKLAPSTIIAATSSSARGKSPLIR